MGLAVKDLYFVNGSDRSVIRFMCSSHTEFFDITMLYFQNGHLFERFCIPVRVFYKCCYWVLSTKFDDGTLSKSKFGLSWDVWVRNRKFLVLIEHAGEKKDLNPLKSSLVGKNHWCYNEWIFVLELAKLSHFSTFCVEFAKIRVLCVEFTFLKFLRGVYQNIRIRFKIHL